VLECLYSSSLFIIVQVLICHVYLSRTNCLYLSSDIVELSDENGIVKDLRRHPYEYGVEYLKERETLILLKVEGDYNMDIRFNGEYSRSLTLVYVLSGIMVFTAIFIVFVFSYISLAYGNF